LPAVNLCQMSELSLVLLALGNKPEFGDVSDRSMSVAALAFAFLALDSTYAIWKSDYILRKTSPLLAKVGLPDLAETAAVAPDSEIKKRIFILGFSWTASSLFEEIMLRKPALLPEIQVVDFNPQVNERLRKRGAHVVYGDIGQRDVLLHAGVAHAETIICSLPDMILKGTSNLKLLRQLRELNPTAKIVVNAERLAHMPVLYAAGANYVTAPRLLEAAELVSVIEAADKDMLDQKRVAQVASLEERDEVIP